MQAKGPHSALWRLNKVLTGAAVLGLALTGNAAWSAGATDSHDSSVPAIAAVMNNYSYILPGTSNYGIAPGSIFVIFGSGMATPGAQAVLQDSTKGLPLTLNGASVAVTVSGLNLQPALYYATPTQIAAVLPSNTPLGTGTITVTYNETTSAPATIQVVQSALGIATMPGDGTGQAMATDANYNFISPTNSAASGQIITLWGTGLGASPADSDTTYTATPHQNTSVPLTVSFLETGHAPAIVWAGRSGYPGLDQINIQIPVGDILGPVYTDGYVTYPPPVVVPVGCSVLLAAADVTTGVGSNIVTLPIAVAGGACTQPSFVLDPNVAQALGGQPTVNFGSLSVSQSGVQVMAGGSFNSIPGSALRAYAGSGTASKVSRP
ncbi:MAG: hypothetical protein ABSB23_21060 [Bryobacteraceae bacterium]